MLRNGATPTQIGNQNCKSLLRQATVCSFIKPYQTRAFLVVSRKIFFGAVVLRRSAAAPGVTGLSASLSSWLRRSHSLARVTPSTMHAVDKFHHRSRVMP